MTREHMTTLRDLRECAAAWDGDAALLGNITARQIVAALDAVLTPPPAPRVVVTEAMVDAAWESLAATNGVTKYDGWNNSPTYPHINLVERVELRAALTAALADADAGGVA